MGVESDTVRCKNCTSVIWRKVESSCSHVETCTLPYVLWVLVEVEISSCKSKAPFSIVETVTCQIPGKSKHASHPKAKRRDDFSRRSCASLASLLGVLTQGAFSFSCIFARVALGASARRHQRTISKSSGPFGPGIASLDASGPVVGVALPQSALALGLVLLA